MAPNFPHPIRGAVLGDPGITPPAFPYGAITLYGGPFQGTSGRRAGVGPGPITPHPRRVIPYGFGLGSSPFPRRYSGNPILVSFPPPTWMFPFGGFPIPGRSPGSEAEAEASTPRRSHSEIPGSTPACGYPGLFAACHVLPRRPSRGIHRPAFSGPGAFPPSSRRRVYAFERDHRELALLPASGAQHPIAERLHAPRYSGWLATYKHYSARII